MKKTFFCAGNFAAVYIGRCLVPAVFLLILFSCNRNVQNSPAEEAARQARVFPTWLSLKEFNYGEPVHPLSDEIIPDDFYPWAGTVSHHILAHEYIDAWFFCLSRMRNPQRFYLISPDHYRLSLERYSLTTGAWDSGFGLAESDINKVMEITESLNVDLDESVFEIEHGISALMPYIKKYFPDAKIAAVVVSGDSRVNTYIAGFLAEVLEKEFDTGGKKENFLIISSDFSHNGNPDETFVNDSISERYLKNPAEESWNIVRCDNRAGIYILDRLGKKSMESRILYHTDSHKISGYGNDITSYFFTFFADREAY
ncbi:MAG: AmmeMemoRadiSam system protein B [Treponema sp.]|nr:AmmeMemoRadiSam system protein B [Treponema sp.]